MELVDDGEEMEVYDSAISANIMLKINLANVSFAHGRQVFANDSHLVKEANVFL